MKKLFIYVVCLLSTLNVLANSYQLDTTKLYDLDEVEITSFYRSTTKTLDVVNRNYLVSVNRGQEPSFIFNSQPSIFSYSDTGNEYGYSYFRLRGMDQTRINMTLDGMPLNEGEDMGVYFSNYPDFIGSLHSVKIEQGASISNNGVAGYAGSIDFESIDLKKDTISSIYLGYGSFNTSKMSVEYNMGIKNGFGLHVKATTQYSDGYREYAHNNSQSLFIKTGYFFNDKHSIDLISFVGLSRNGQGWIGSTLEELEINPKHNGCTKAESDRFVQNVNKLHYKGFLTNNVTLNASVYYSFLDGYYYFDLDNFLIKMDSPTWQPTNIIDKYNLQHHMFGGNVASKIYLDNFTITSGLNFSLFNRNHYGTNCGDLYDNTGYKNDVNLFVKGEYQYKGLHILGNVQYRHADFDYVGDIEFDKINWNFFNWSGEISYTFINKYKLYGKVTQTHREPTRTDMFYGNEYYPGELSTTQAESVIDYETGLNINVKKLNANINAYFMDFDNELILSGQFGPNGLPIHSNAAKSFRTGLELNLECTPVHWLKLINSSSYSINRVISDDIEMTHIMSPSWLVNQSVIYTNKKFECGVDLKYRSSMFIDLANNYKLDGNVKLNAYAKYTINDALTLGLVVNNILNDKSYSNAMLGADNKVLYFTDSPINFNISLKWTF